MWNKLGFVLIFLLVTLLIMGCVNPQRDISPRDDTHHRKMFIINANLTELDVIDNLGKGTISIDITDAKVDNELYIEVSINNFSNNDLIPVDHFSDYFKLEVGGNKKFKVPFVDLPLGQYDIKVHVITRQPNADGDTFGELEHIYLTVTSDEIVPFWEHFGSPSVEAEKGK